MHIYLLYNYVYYIWYIIYSYILICYMYINRLIVYLVVCFIQLLENFLRIEILDETRKDPEYVYDIYFAEDNIVVPSEE